MTGNLIITIGRQYGSGGREIGMRLAEELGIKCYDSELLTKAAKVSGMSEEIFEKHDEKPTNSFLYSLVMDTYATGYNAAAFYDMPLNHKVFLAQFNAIKEIAKEESCVIVGRCADYALEDYPNVLSVYIHAPLESRVKRIMDKYELSEEKAKEAIQKTDKKRAAYYNYFTNKKWGDSESYDFCINSSLLGIDGTVDLIKSIVEKKEIIK